MLLVEYPDKLIITDYLTENINLDGYIGLLEFETLVELLDELQAKEGLTLFITDITSYPYLIILG